MNITRRFLLWGAAAVAAVQTIKPVAAAMSPAATPLPSWVPNGWLPCWGQSVSRKEYPRLFAAIGETYGAPDAERFNLPDLRARYYAAPGPFGSSVSAVVDPGHTHSISTPAEPTHTHTFTEMPVAPTVTLENIISTGKLDHVGGALPAGSVVHFAAPTA